MANLIMNKEMNGQKVNLFDFLKSISETKEPLFELEDFNKKYTPFMVNRFLSASQDTLFFANVMSQFSHLPEKLQYAFLFYGINKKKRYFQYSGKGNKNKDTELDCIVKYYQCSHEQGLSYQELLNDEQIKDIMRVYDTRISKGTLK